MKLTQKLLGFLNRAFSRDPVQFLAMRLRYDGAMTWAVEDAVLTTTVAGGSGAPLVVDLTLYTLAELANHLNAQPGYSVVYRVTSEASLVGARTLLGGTNDQDSSNGDHLYAFTSLTWAYLDANAVELKTAREQIYQMLRQMVVPTAENEWLDEIGGFYNVPRNNGEPDAIYGPRIIYEVTRPRNNNKAIEIAISVATGGLPSKVTDVTENGSMAPLYDGAIDFNGAYYYNASGTRRRNLFDVEYAFDLEGSEDVAPFQARVLELIDKFRSAGTHLRQILLTGSQLSDNLVLTATENLSFATTYTAADAVSSATDSHALNAALGLTDTAAPTADGDLGLSMVSAHTYNGVHLYGGAGRVVLYNSGQTVAETL